MPSSNVQNQNFIQQGVNDAKKNFLEGAEATNNSFGPVAGAELQQGRGATMTQFNLNKRSIEEAKNNL